ncbi:MAG: DUF3592 domain-containing protein [Planctomycetaceae bacterium]|nr:DUF3592 domain-containing protein [Planctomycetaceae bacterium]
MARFWFFSKKRGERRTTSDTGGRAALALFFAALAIVGGAILATIISQVTAPEWRANHEFRETRALVLAKRIAEQTHELKTMYRPEVTIRYPAGEKTYETATYDATGVFTTERGESEKLLEAFDVGKEYPAWYDPQEPDSAVLVRGYSWIAWVLPLLPAAFVAVGIGGLIYVFLTWGKSAERRALLQQSANVDLFDHGGAASRLPTVPSDRDVTNSPGTTLNYRIPNALPGWNSLFLTGVALGWNTLVGYFVYQAIGEAIDGRADYLLWLGLIPFLLAGGYFAYLAARQLMIAGGIEPTLVEMSAHPLYPGGRYEVYLAQPGRLDFSRLTVLLVCDEEATFRQGTNSHTHQQRVYEAEVYRREKFTVERSEPLAVRFELAVPEGAMHSFQSPRNAVRWKLLVRGVLNNWPDFERAFVVLVYPGRNGAAYS